MKNNNDHGKCKACGQKPGNCLGHVLLREVIYDQGVVRPAQSYASTSLGTWGNKWGNS